MTITPGSVLFLDTNILIYALTEHPRFGRWCDDLLTRISRGEVKGYISVIVLNELLYKLVIGEVAQKARISLNQVAHYVKRQPGLLANLEAYEVVAEVETGYRLHISAVTRETFTLARQLMAEYHLLSNDALHLAVMRERNIGNLVTNDADFERVSNIRVWKPEELTDFSSR